MSFNRHDWARLRKPLLVFGLVLVVVGMLAYYSSEYHDRQQTQRNMQQQALNEARQKYLSSGQERDTIIRYLPVYQQLIRDGFIGEEQRIEWLEKLRQLHIQHKLFSIEYHIDQQEKVTPTYLPSTGQFSLYSSSMRLKMSLLHEGDILKLLNGLEEQTVPFIIKECELLRPVGAKVNSKLLVANIESSCLIDWYTLRMPVTRETAS